MHFKDQYSTDYPGTFSVHVDVDVLLSILAYIVQEVQVLEALESFQLFLYYNLFPLSKTFPFYTQVSNQGEIG